MSIAWTQTPQACVSTYFTIATNFPSPFLPDEARASFYQLIPLRKLLGEMLKIQTGPEATIVTYAVGSNLKSSRQR